MSDKLASISEGKSPLRGVWAWFAGRSRRREYWLWAVPWFIATGVVAIVAPGFEVALGPVLLAVWIRRLHDLGLSGWIAPLVNVALGVIGFVEAGIPATFGGGGVVEGLVALAAIIVLGVIPGQSKTNAYGPPPGGSKAEASETLA